MKKFSLKRASVLSDQNRNALRGGSYSLVVTAIVLAILIAVNVFASALPKSMTTMISAPASSIPSPATQRSWSTIFSRM